MKYLCGQLLGPSSTTFRKLRTKFTKFQNTYQKLGDDSLFRQGPKCLRKGLRKNKRQIYLKMNIWKMKHLVKMGRMLLAKIE